MGIPTLSNTNTPNVKTDAAGNYWVDVTVDGRRRRRKCSSLKHAKELLRNQAALFKDDHRPPPTQTLSELAAKYRAEDELKNVDHRNHATMEQTLVRILGDPPFRLLSKADVARYQIERSKEGVGPVRINHETIRLQRLLSLAVRDGLIEKNALEKHEQLEEPPGRLRWMTADEEAIIRPRMSRADWRLCEINFRSGMRQTEQFRLQLSDIRWDANLIRLPETKNGDARDIPMGKKLRRAMEEQRQLGRAVDFVWKLGSDVHAELRVPHFLLAEYLNGDRGMDELGHPLPGEALQEALLELRSRFCEEGGEDSRWVCLNPKTMAPWDGNSFYKYRWFSASRAAGVIDLCWHEAGRHTFASRLAMRGVSLYTIQKLLGHRSIKTTERYAHLCRGHLQEAAEVIDLD